MSVVYTKWFQLHRTCVGDKKTPSYARASYRRIFKNGKNARNDSTSGARPRSFTIRDIFLAAKQYLVQAAGFYSSSRKRIRDPLITRDSARMYFMSSSYLDSLCGSTYVYVCVCVYRSYIYISLLIKNKLRTFFVKTLTFCYN